MKLEIDKVPYLVELASESSKIMESINSMKSNSQNIETEVVERILDQELKEANIREQ